MGCTISSKNNPAIKLIKGSQSNDDELREVRSKESTLRKDDKTAVRFEREGGDSDSVKNALADFIALNALPNEDVSVNEYSPTRGYLYCYYYKIHIWIIS